VLVDPSIEELVDDDRGTEEVLEIALELIDAILAVVTVVKLEII